MVNVGLREAEGIGMDFCQDIITLINENQAKQTTIFSEGYEGYVLD